MHNKLLILIHDTYCPRFLQTKCSIYQPFMNSLIVRYIFSAITFVISIIRKHSFICYCPCGYKKK